MPQSDLLTFDFDSPSRPVKEETPKIRSSVQKVGKSRKNYGSSEPKERTTQVTAPRDALTPEDLPDDESIWDGVAAWDVPPPKLPAKKKLSQAARQAEKEILDEGPREELPKRLPKKLPKKLPEIPPEVQPKEEIPSAPEEFGSKTVLQDLHPLPGSTTPQQSPPNRNETFISPNSLPSKSPLHGETIHGGFGGTSPSTSPRSAFRLPARKANGYQSFGDYHVPLAKNRPVSMLSHYSHAQPLPHHPQAHYFGVRETDLGLPSRSTSRKSTADDYLAFDSLVVGPEEMTASGNTILFSGSENGLVINRLDKSKLRHLGQLQGLRGRVIAAKMIPRASRDDPLEMYRPLIALIVHGPAMLPAEPERPSTSQAKDEFDATASTILALQSADPVYTTSSTLYQTTVEIYSLAEERHITTLFSSPLANAEPSLGPQSSVAPDSLGNLSIDAKGRFLIVTSGISGEVYIFEAARVLSESQPEPFTCIGKTWTSMPSRRTRTWSTSSSSSEPDSSHDASPARTGRLVEGMVSLSPRWLAIVPPVPQSQTTFYGRINLPSESKPPPGLKSHTASSQPAAISDIDSPLEESLLNRVARDVTQEVIKGARWVGDQGIHAWKSYWTKPVESSLPYETMAPSMPPLFPPTHAHDERMRISHKPTLISIIDLERLSNNHDAKVGTALQPMATFALSGGCSFLSFSPNGLCLLTASAKGDVQQVWDLMRVVHGKAGMALGRDTTGSETASIIRQVARFTRMTVANIVDVVWTEPNGEKLGIVTDHGTVHVFDLPPSAFQWPPLRRTGRRAVSKPEDTKAGAGGGTTGAFTSAMNIVSGSTQPLLAAVRGRPPSIGSGISSLGGLSLTAGAGVKGGKLVASGFSKSVEAASGTVSTIRHMGDNKLAIPRSNAPLKRGCVRWTLIKDRCQLNVGGGGIVRTHEVHLRLRQESGHNRVSVVGPKTADLVILSSPPECPHADAAEGLSHHRSNTATTLISAPTIQWPRSPPFILHPRKSTAAIASHGQPLSFAEIETNAPYQPFHTDRRINLYLYADTDAGMHFRDSTPWIFGGDMPVVRISAGADNTSDGDVALDPSEQIPGLKSGVGDHDGNIEATATTDYDDPSQHVVITTRRKRGRRAGQDVEAASEEFFEDDLDIVDFADERV